jgi:hypothetical protein
MFATKPELAGELLACAHERGIRAAFVAIRSTAGGSFAAGSAARAELQEAARPPSAPAVGYAEPPGTTGARETR